MLARILSNLAPLLLGPILLGACVYTPVDGSELDPAGFDGTPPIFGIAGAGYGKAVTLRVDAFNYEVGEWQPVKETVASVNEYKDGLYLFGTGVKVRSLGQVLRDDAAEMSEILVRMQQDVGGQTINLATFDAAAQQCLQAALNAGVGPLDAGAECYSGGEARLFFPDPPSTDSQPAVMTNFDDFCGSLNVLRASDGEDGHRLAQRFSPPFFPFAVDEIEYTLFHNPTDNPPSVQIGCRSDLDHRVELFVVPAGEPPPSDPVEVFTYHGSAPVPALTQPVNAFIALESSITIDEGEQLFVSIEMIRESSAAIICVVSCAEAESVTNNEHYWSNAAKPPYDWTQLSDFGISVTPRVIVHGRVPEL